MKSEKAVFMIKVNATFNKIREVMNTIELNLTSDDVDVEARSSVLATNLIVHFNDFLEAMKVLINTN